ncbi:MAG: DUF3426 domain-containing protein [Burkholderiaceae bacterium]
MALATTCPSCKTSFKVLSEQLKLRRGMVRCGICQQVFSGVEYLRYVNDARTAAAQSTSNPQTVAADLHTAFFLPETRLAEDDAPGAFDGLGSTGRQPRMIRRRWQTRTRQAPPPVAGSPDWPGITDDHPAWAERHLGDGAPIPAESSATATAGPVAGSDTAGSDDEWPSTMIWPRPPDEGIVEVVESSASSQPAAGTTVVGRAAPPAFIARRRQPEPAPPPMTEADAEDMAAALGESDEPDEAVDFFGRSTNAAFDFDLPPRGVWIAAGVLTLLLSAQVLIGAREVIAARVPAMRGALSTLSAPFGLDVGVPIRAEAITIESFDLARSPEGRSRYRLNMLLRNRAGMALRWPSIELTLTDSTGGILVRKALQPDTYLGDTATVEAGMQGDSEKPIRLTLETADIAPSGYSAVLFYH